MRFLRLFASVVALAASATPSLRAQVGKGSVLTIGAVHMAVLPAPEGIVRVYVSADAAAGDAVSGLIVAQATGDTAQARQANLLRLNSFVVQLEEQQAPVSERRYQWLIPRTLRAGSGALQLQQSDGRIISHASLPVDPVPAPPPGSSAPRGVELPTEGQGGMTAAIRGRFDGRLDGKAVAFGGTQADVLAVSPRQVVFLVPGTATGLVPIRFDVDGQPTGGATLLRVFGVQAAVPTLGQGQKGALKVEVSGLRDIKEAVWLTLRNQSPDIFRLENIDRPVTIEPGRVTRQGTSVVNRQITGVRGGRGNILATVGSRPLAQFDRDRSTDRVLADWQAKTGVGITPEAKTQIVRSVGAAQARLDDFLTRQRANQGDVQAVFAALLSHYCFDLRDDSLSRRRVDRGRPAGPGMRLVAFGQAPAPGVEITAGEVRNLSFSDFLSELIGRFTREQQAVGYLFVSSTPMQAPITIDGRGKGQVTNRRFVTPAGDHVVVVGAQQPCREPVTVIPFQTKVVHCADR